MAPAPQHHALFVEVVAELGRGHISEAYIVVDRGKGEHCHGFTDTASHHITVNIVHQTCDTVIHELLHRLYPGWSERYVRNRTAYLRNRMTDQETRALYAEYQRQVYRPAQTRLVRGADA